MRACELCESFSQRVLYMVHPVSVKHGNRSSLNIRLRATVDFRSILPSSPVLSPPLWCTSFNGPSLHSQAQPPQLISSRLPCDPFACKPCNPPDGSSALHKGTSAAALSINFAACSVAGLSPLIRVISVASHHHHANAELLNSKRVNCRRLASWPSSLSPRGQEHCGHAKGARYACFLRGKLLAILSSWARRYLGPMAHPRRLRAGESAPLAC